MKYISFQRLLSILIILQMSLAIVVPKVESSNKAQKTTIKENMNYNIAPTKETKTTNNEGNIQMAIIEKNEVNSTQKARRHITICNIIKVLGTLTQHGVEPNIEKIRTKSTQANKKGNFVNKTLDYEDYEVPPTNEIKTISSKANIQQPFTEIKELNLTKIICRSILHKKCQAMQLLEQRKIEKTNLPTRKPQQLFSKTLSSIKPHKTTTNNKIDYYDVTPTKQMKTINLEAAPQPPMIEEKKLNSTKRIRRSIIGDIFKLIEEDSPEEEYTDYEEPRNTPPTEREEYKSRSTQSMEFTRMVYRFTTQSLRYIYHPNTRFVKPTRAMFRFYTPSTRLAGFTNGPTKRRGRPTIYKGGFKQYRRLTTQMQQTEPTVPTEPFEQFDPLWFFSTFPPGQTRFPMPTAGIPDDFDVTWTTQPSIVFDQRHEMRPPSQTYPPGQTRFTWPNIFKTTPIQN